ncbi:hypothetical protein NQ318_022261 [Aromia moschata]|uniref:Transposase n=1 Tax=Aromia moschata TaxID=1265417 RepID=A0AAV8XGR3_9CUCU|nr:hypothetical protein NQ318_022261 [Aromia moschata]
MHYLHIPKSGRKRILDDEQKLDILLDIQDNPHKPSRQVAADNDVKTLVLNGTVNKQNCRYWSTENPHWMMEANTQYPEKNRKLAELRMLFLDDDNPNEMDKNIWF